MFPVPPFAIASVPVAFPTGMLVQLDRLPDVGVPRLALLSVGLKMLALEIVGPFDNTFEPVPVDAVVPVPPFATGSVPVAEETLIPVQFDRLPEVGVPSVGDVSVGEVSVGDVLNTTFPDPVDVVTPVPPCATVSGNVNTGCAPITDNAVVPSNASWDADVNCPSWLDASLPRELSVATPLIAPS